MKISDLLKLSLDNLKRRKGRTILTVSGVVIGTCSIIMMVSIGVALNKAQEETISNMGDLTKIDVYNWKDEKEQDPITDDVVAAFKSIENVKIATPIFQSNYIGDISVFGGSSGKYQLHGWIGDSVVGMYKEAIADYGYELADGRYLTANDKPYMVMVGEMVNYQFTNPKKQWPHDRVDPEPDENGNLPKPFVNVYKDKLILKVGANSDNKSVEKQIKVVGAIKQDFSKGYETYGGIIMDLEDLVALEKEYIKLNKIKVTGQSNKKRTYQRAVVKVTDMKYVDDVIKAIEDMGYNTSSAASWRNEMKKQTQTIQLVLAGLGSISLLVAAIGIANTMTMAIYERRREIGIMKVLGCELKNIKGMFLAESAGIGFLGGIIGLVVSYGLSYLLNTLLGGSFGYGDKISISIIPIWLALVGIAFSTFVGIVSGYVPANKAVKISALTAIKNE